MLVWLIKTGHHCSLIFSWSLVDRSNCQVLGSSHDLSVEMVVSNNCFTSFFQCFSSPPTTNWHAKTIWKSQLWAPETTCSDTRKCLGKRGSFLERFPGWSLRGTPMKLSQVLSGLEMLWSGFDLPSPHWGCIENHTGFWSFSSRFSRW